MTPVKFIRVKLINRILVLAFLLNFITPFNSLSAQRIAIQVAASTTPVNREDFSRKHHITDSITEIKAGNWYHYYVGSFDNIESASEFAVDFSSKTGIKGVFPRKIYVKTENPIPEKPLSAAIQQPDTVKPGLAVSPAYQDTVAEKQEGKPGDASNELFRKIFGNKNISELQKDLILYANNNLPVFLRKLFIRIVEKTYTYPIILLFIFMILFFLLNIILVLLVLYYSNKQKNHRDKYVRVFGNMYEEVLRSYLFGEMNWDSALIKLKRIKKPLNRRILTSVLINFQENLRGEMDTRMPEIYYKLGLYEDALKETRSSMYDKKVQGIHELTNLYPKGAEEIIQSYINYSNDLVRAEAQTSYIRLHPDNPFDFLKKLTSPFTRWTQLNAFYLFRLHQLPVPAFINYLNSEHPTVRNFCLRMIIHFQQLENASEIFKLLGSDQEQTRFLCIRAINDLRLIDGRDLIKKRYPGETPKNRMEIIKAFRNTGNAEDYDFLENIIRTGSVSAKTEACRSMYFMSSDGRERLEMLKRNDDLQIEQYLAHVTDPRN